VKKAKNLFVYRTSTRLQNSVIIVLYCFRLEKKYKKRWNMESK